MDRRKIARNLRRTAVGVVAALALALVTLKLLYGRGTPYPDASSTPLVADKDVAAA